MNSLPTLKFLIHSKHLKYAALALCLMLPGLPVMAHDDQDPIPSEGLRVAVALAVSDVRAAQNLPSQRLDGYLLRGDRGVDRRASQLENGVLSAGWRLNPQWSVYSAIGQHDADTAHIEAAWVRFELPPQSGGKTMSFQLGRTHPELGPVLTRAGHMDDYTLMPLMKRVAWDGNWQDDGVQVGVQRGGQGWTTHLDVGVWRGRVFPASPSANAAPSLHLGLTRGDWRGDLFAVSFRADGRGALTQGNLGGHTHNAPACETLQAQVLCFSGRTRVVGGSLQWQSHDWPLTVQGAYALRSDQGTLRSVNGLAQHAGDYQGGWLQVSWEPVGDWRVGLRTERIQARLSLDGAGASLLAQETGLQSSAPVRRDTVTAGWQPNAYVTVLAQAGREVNGIKSVRFTALRLVLQGRWNGALSL